MRATLLLLLLLIAPVRSEGQVRQGGAWHLTDQPSITLELDALNVVRGATVTFRPALYLRCLDEKLEAFVATGTVRGGDADYRTSVRLRWADRPPLGQTWSRSTDYAALFAPDPAAFIQQILATPELVFEFQLTGSAPIAAQFNGAGLDAHLPTLKTRCRGVASPHPAADSVYAEAQVDERAELLSRREAEYPTLLRRAGIQGTVIVEAVVDTLGRVVAGSVRVISSPNPGFNEPALDAIRQAVFRPARVHGRPVSVRLRVPLTFRDD